MRERAPFYMDDIEEIDEKFFSRASAVVAMQECAAGNRSPTVLGLRHDCDAGHSLATAVKMAEWEADRGYRSTYFCLHTSPYWHYPEFRESLERISILGHEIGLHANGIAEALRTGRDPDLIIDEALETLRGYGFQVRGVAGHGDPLCNRDRAPGEISCANDEQFLETVRPQEGEPDRVITRGHIQVKLRPRPLADFGLTYEALHEGLPKPFRISDSGGRWLRPGFQETADRFPDPEKQCHFLQHPDWYREAWNLSAVAA